MIHYNTPWCEAHPKQREFLHTFNHTAEDQREFLNPVELDDLEGDVEIKRIEIVLLTVALVAGNALTDWFYKGQSDFGHAEWEFVLTPRRAVARKRLFYMGYGIITNNSDFVLQRNIRNALLHFKPARVMVFLDGENSTEVLLGPAPAAEFAGSYVEILGLVPRSWARLLLFYIFI
ncbi:hypothetical protein PG996_010540 [Apiospora saccharicola]|uniref:Uncharacterized protein n=1 Tax=Apiospora saccharicola TaxID=335842 RepID=A0ABR1UNV6_9PEZI